MGMIHNRCKDNSELPIKDLHLKTCNGDDLPAGSLMARCQDIPVITGLQDKLKDCAGVDLPAGTRMAKCSDIPNVSGFQNKLKDCDGNFLVGGELVALCSDIPSVPDVSGFQNKLKDCDGNFLAGGENIAQCSDLPGVATSTVSGTITTAEVESLAKIVAKEEGTVLASGGFKTVNFVGEGLTATQSGTDLTVTSNPATATAGGTVTLNQIETLTKILAKDEGTALSTTGVKTIDFVGSNIVATQAGSVLTVTSNKDGVTFGTAVTNFNSSAPTDGNTFYRNTTTGELWKWDGSKWSAIGDYAKGDITIASFSLPASTGANSVTSTQNITAPRSGTIVVNARASGSGGIGGKIVSSYIRINGVNKSVSRANDTTDIALFSSTSAVVQVVAGDIITMGMELSRPVGASYILTGSGTGDWSYIS